MGERWNASPRRPSASKRRQGWRSLLVSRESSFPSHSLLIRLSFWATRRAAGVRHLQPLPRPNLRPKVDLLNLRPFSLYCVPKMARTSPMEIMLKVGHQCATSSYYFLQCRVGALLHALIHFSPARTKLIVNFSCIHNTFPAGSSSTLDGSLS